MKKKKTRKFFPISETTLLFGRFPNFVRLSVWYKQHVDEDEYEALVDSC